MVEQGSSFNPESEKIDNLDSLLERFDSQTDKIPESLRQKSTDELFELWKQGVDLYKNLYPADMRTITDRDERNRRYLDFTKVAAVNRLINNIVSDRLDQRISGPDESMRALQLKQQEVQWKQDLTQVEVQRATSAGEFSKAEELQKTYWLLAKESFQAGQEIGDLSFKNLQEKWSKPIA
ncbi:MAG: hypothetical protein WAP74_02925 [Patescibacteria group bacterium]